MPKNRLLRLGILCIPEMDDQAVSAILRALQQAHPPVALLMSAGARSQRNWLEETLCNWCDVEELDILITIGGTLPAPGPSAEEIVPEVTRAVAERLLPGLAEAMRYHAQAESSLAWLERGIVGIRGRTVIVNLPAGAAPALLFLEAILDLLPVVVDHLQGDPTAPRMLDEVTLVDAEGDPEDGAAVPTPPSAQQTPHKGLQAEEFAAFLKRNQDKER